jgi:hypothetical protein
MHGMAGAAQVGGDQGLDGGFVFDDQDVGRHGATSRIVNASLLQPHDGFVTAAARRQERRLAL